MAPCILAPANNKGGTGKTTVCKMLAEYFALIAGKRVLLIDLDPQCNISGQYLEMETEAEHGRWEPPVHPAFVPDDPDTPGWNGRSSSANIWLSDYVTEYPTRIEKLFILPGDSLKLESVERVHQHEVQTKVESAFVDFLRNEEWIQDEYDVVLIDTAPALGPLTRSALRACDEMLIPTKMERLALDGLAGMLTVWREMQNQAGRNGARPLHLAGVLPTQVSGFRPAELMLYEQLRRGLLQPHMTANLVHEWSGYKTWMLPDDKSLFELPPSDKHRQEAMRVCEEIVERLEVRP